MKVSVLIATRDRPEALRRCVASIARQTYTDLDLLIIDDAPEVPLDTEAVRATVGTVPVHFMHSAERLGPAGCRNWLMQQARGDMLVLLDDDAWFANEDAITHVVAAFKECPDAGILAFKLIDLDPKDQRRDHVLVPYGQRRIRRQPHLVEQRSLVGHYLAGGHAVRRVVPEQCGYFPDTLRYGHEELDLSYRALDAGFTIVYLPAVTVYHQRDDTGAFADWKLALSLRNRLRIAFTYLPARYIPSHVGCWLGVYGLRALRHGIPGAFWHGLREGLAGWNDRPRRPLRPATIAYLKAHGGRLWW